MFKQEEKGEDRVPPGNEDVRLAVFRERILNSDFLLSPVRKSTSRLGRVQQNTG